MNELLNQILKANRNIMILAAAAVAYAAVQAKKMKQLEYEIKELKRTKGE